MPEEIKLETTGRNRYTKRITFTVRIDEEAYNKILQYAEANKISKSKAIRELLIKGVQLGQQQR
jgi:hypothetical protein